MTVGRMLAWPLITLIKVYQRVWSPMRPPTCRFYPSCSAYAVTALERFGPVKGTWLALRRLFRCHPWNPGGVDHVPPARRQVQSGGGGDVQGFDAHGFERSRPLVEQPASIEPLGARPR